MNETMTKTLYGYLIDVDGTNSGPVEIEKSLEGYYQALSCDIITITYLPINGKEYCLICDDEGLLKHNPKVSAVSQDYKPMLVGNLLIVLGEADDDGEFRSLIHNDVLAIDECVKYVLQDKEVHPVVVIG